MAMSGHEAFDRVLQKMREQKMRITKPRKALLKTLMLAPQPISVEALHSQLGEKDFDLVTIYRNLEAFEQVGLVHKFMTESGKALYEWMLEDHHHHHILCRKCHQAECLDICDIENLEKLANELGYSEVTHVLELYGVCAKCRAE